MVSEPLAPARRSAAPTTRARSPHKGMNTSSHGDSCNRRSYTPSTTARSNRATPRPVSAPVTSGEQRRHLAIEQDELTEALGRLRAGSSRPTLEPAGIGGFIGRVAQSPRPAQHGRAFSSWGQATRRRPARFAASPLTRSTRRRPFDGQCDAHLRRLAGDVSIDEMLGHEAITGARDGRRVAAERVGQIGGSLRSAAGEDHQGPILRECHIVVDVGQRAGHDRHEHPRHRGAPRRPTRVPPPTRVLLSTTIVDCNLEPSPCSASVVHAAHHRAIGAGPACEDSVPKYRSPVLDRRVLPDGGVVARAVRGWRRSSGLPGSLHGRGWGR